MKIWLPALLIVVVLVLFVGLSYNRFVKKDEMVTRTWNNLQSDYQRRLDLIPDLVNVVKGSATYENETLQKVMLARSKAASVKVSTGFDAGSALQTEKIQAELAQSSNKLIAVIEQYPDLKTTTHFIRLQDQLEGTERRIKFSRKDFNDAVAEYNKSVRSFPGNIAAKILGFKIKEGFQAEAGADKVTEIEFNKK